MGETTMPLKRYATPALTMYGRLEDVTKVYSNPVTTDNDCPGNQGSLTFGSGSICLPVPVPPAAPSVDLPAQLDLIAPELAAELTSIGGE